jgi:hypothetical protein
MEGPDMLGPDMLGPLMLPPADWAMAPDARSDAVSDAKRIPDRRMEILPDLLIWPVLRLKYVRRADA